MPSRAAHKRKPSASPTSNHEADKKKKIKLESSDSHGSEEPSTPTPSLQEKHHFAADIAKHGIGMPQFYPLEMSNARAEAYTNEVIPRPIETLLSALKDTATVRRKVAVKDAVVHWFKSDLRTRDNRALWMASEKAKQAGVPLVGLYVVSPQDWEAHLTAPVRVDFTMRTLHVLQRDLATLDIPLCVATVEKRKDLPGRVLELAKKWHASHIYANMEYEVDELRREARLVRACADRGIDLQVVHDTCVVPPGALRSGSGKQYAVYTPWYHAWMAHIRANPELLTLFDVPARNPALARKTYADLFDAPIPPVPENKALSPETADSLRALWPPGEHEAMARLEKFCKERINKYHEKRNIPIDAATSSLSVHLAAGTLSARTAVKMARDRNKTKSLDGGADGVKVWISEVAWRDFYKHIMVGWPYVCMNKPFKPAYANIEWSYDEQSLKAWQTGNTGYPIVDAAMRQMLNTGYMHNRCRMIVASFLAKDLLLDWRLGERYFMLNLIDGDVASNNGGWGFSASVGADPQPYFRVFNPILQSEKFDPQGEYIRKWVPELKGCSAKEVHDPYGRGAGSKVGARGYPKMIVEHKAARLRALEVYKRGMGKTG